MNWLKIGRIFNGRVVRNILFWLLFTWYHYTGSNKVLYHYPILFFTLFISYGIPCYFNNLFLIPRYLFARKYFKFILFFLLLFAITVVVSYYITIRVNHWFEGLNYMGSSKDVPLPYHAFPTAFMFAIFSAGKFTSDAISSQQKMLHMQQEKLQSELQSLKSQLNPHFLFNALNTVYGLSRKKSTNTSGAILTLSEILRYVLYESNVEYIDLQSEIDFLQEYVKFQKLRQRTETEMRFEVRNMNEGLRIAPLLLLPLVENAIKHGPEKKLKNMWIQIDISMEANWFIFQCRNNYKKSAKDQRSGGLGLANIKKRLELMYPKKHELLIRDSENIFDVQLKLLLK